MAETTGIAWCDATFNPWIGCTAVSPGCDNCYARADFQDRKHRATWGAGQPRSRTSETNWSMPLKWQRGHDKFMALHGRRRRVFCASLADVFDNEVPAEWRADLFELIAATPNIDWLLLTKRIGNTHRMIDMTMDSIDRRQSAGTSTIVRSAWPWPNVWLGATICNQAEADRDIPKLLAVPAARRFLSIEPMLGPVDLSTHRGAKGLPIYWEGTPADGPMRNYCGYTGRSLTDTTRRGWVKTSENMSPWLDWVICGGESGPRARPMHPDWVRSLRDQCAAASVPFFFKQWGEYVPCETEASDDTGRRNVFADECCGLELPGRLMDVAQAHGAEFVSVGTKDAGRLFDGREHSEFPGG